MSVIHGVNTYVCDPQTGSVISDAWCQNIVDMGVTHVRVDLRADASNHLPQALYLRGVSTLVRHGLVPVGVISEDFNRPWLEGNPSRVMYPNEALNYQGNKRHNRWILDTCVRAGMFAKAMVGAGMTHFSTCNETNLQGSIAIGHNVPPVAGDKSGALAPEVFASYAYELAGWLRRAGATHIEYGAQSWIAGSGPDKGNPYCAGYLRKGFAYLLSTGVKAMEVRSGVLVPRFDSVSVNAEGWWLEETADAMAHAISQAALTFNWINPPLIIGEWGERADAYNATYFQETAAALSGIASEMYLFSHPCRTPNTLADYGLVDWIDAGGYLAPGPGRSTVFGPFCALVKSAAIPQSWHDKHAALEDTVDRKNLLIRGALGVGAVIGSAALSLVPERVGTALAAPASNVLPKCGRLCPVYCDIFCDWSWTICAVDGLQSRVQKVIWLDCNEIWYICHVEDKWLGSCCPNPPYYV